MCVPEQNCASPRAEASDNSSIRPVLALSIVETCRRFGLPRQTLHQMRERWPHIAVAEPARRGPELWRWAIDPIDLTLMLAECGRLDLDAAARRFGVSRAVFDGLNVGQIGVWLAIWPWPDRPPDRPSPPVLAAAEVGDGAR